MLSERKKFCKITYSTSQKSKDTKEVPSPRDGTEDRQWNLPWFLCFLKRWSDRPPWNSIHLRNTHFYKHAFIQYTIVPSKTTAMGAVAEQWQEWEAKRLSQWDLARGSIVGQRQHQKLTQAMTTVTCDPRVHGIYGNVINLITYMRPTQGEPCIGMGMWYVRHTVWYARLRDISIIPSTEYSGTPHHTTVSKKLVQRRYNKKKEIRKEWQQT